MRLFTAFDIPETFSMDLKKRLLPILLKQQQLKIPVWENLHLTCHFFGECDENKKKAIENLLSTVSFSPISITIRKMGFFYDREKKPRIVFLNIESPSLVAFYDKTTELLQSQKLYEETRLYHPHLTLFRLKYSVSPSLLQKLQEKTEDIDFQYSVSSLTLYQSILRPQRAEYQKITCFEFAKKER